MVITDKKITVLHNMCALYYITEQTPKEVYM